MDERTKAATEALDLAVRQAIDELTRLSARRAVLCRSLRIPAAAWDALYALARAASAPPNISSASTTPAALTSYARRASRAAALSMRILSELPPHADRRPEDLAEAIEEARTFLLDVVL